jgi:hypothetical protein
VDVDGRERVGVHHNFSPICYHLGGKRIRGAKHLPHHICSHIWHLTDKFGANLSNLPHLPFHPKPPGTISTFI